MIRGWLRSAPGLLALALTLVACCSGCRGPTGRTLKVDEAQAKAALDWFLEQWKLGYPIDSIQTRTPPIIGVDDDWRQGVKLVSYEYKDTENDGANLHARVILRTTRIGMFEDRPPVEEIQYAMYTVSTQPVVTVFRDL